MGGTKIKMINLYPKDDSKTKSSHALWSLEHDRVMNLSIGQMKGFGLLQGLSGKIFLLITMNTAIIFSAILKYILPC